MLYEEISAGKVAGKNNSYDIESASERFRCDRFRSLFQRTTSLQRRRFFPKDPEVFGDLGELIFPRRRYATIVAPDQRRCRNIRDKFDYTRVFHFEIICIHNFFSYT